MLGVLLGLSACTGAPGQEGGDSPASNSPLSASPNRGATSVPPAPTPATPAATSSTPAAPATSAPATSGRPPVAADQQFTLDDAAQFDDGLIIEIAGTVADRAKSSDRGAEGTGGEIVIASVRIENNSSDPYDARDVLISAGYGGSDARLADAQIVVDSTGELESGFAGTIDVGDEGIATIGFAVPFSALGRVSFVVDPNDDIHDAVSFTGRVLRE